MKRAERSEYTLIKNSLKKHDLGYGTALTIRTDASAEYKHALSDLYTSLGFHPADIKVDLHRFDDKERIIYIYGLTWNLRGEDRSWTELYTPAERARLAAALD